MNSLAQKDRERIFELFQKNHRLHFADIEKAVEIQANSLAYHIEKMIEDNILMKENADYLLTPHGETLLPALKQIIGKEQGPLGIVVSAVLKGDKICLLKREKRPYKGYWVCPGGKSHLHESIKDTALRETKEETGLSCKFDKVRAVIHERVREDGIFKHAFIIYFCTLHSETTELSVTDEGIVKWFDIKALPEKIVPSDDLVLKNFLDKEHVVKDVIIEQSGEKLIDIKIEDGGIL
jgi:8-oxo-dGTP diphosphatase